MPSMGEKYYDIIRRKAYYDALSALDALIMTTPTGPIREKLTEANILVMQCQDRQKQIDAHG